MGDLIVTVSSSDEAPQTQPAKDATDAEALTVEAPRPVSEADALTVEAPRLEVPKANAPASPAQQPEPPQSKGEAKPIPGARSDLATIDGKSSRYFEPIVSFPFVPTLEGQYIIKNVVLVAAAIVLGATVRGGELTPAPVEELAPDPPAAAAR